MGLRCNNSSEDPHPSGSVRQSDCPHFHNCRCRSGVFVVVLVVAFDGCEGVVLSNHHSRRRRRQSRLPFLCLFFFLLYYCGFDGVTTSDFFSLSFLNRFVAQVRIFGHHRWWLLLLLLFVVVSSQFVEEVAWLGSRSPVEI